jgi:hypothetical protein
MLVMKVYRGTGSAADLIQSFVNLTERLDNEFVPVTVAARQAQATILGIDLANLTAIGSNDLPAASPFAVETGELFSKNRSLFGVTVAVETRRPTLEDSTPSAILRVFALGDSSIISATFDEFYATVETVFNCPLSQTVIKSDRTRTLQAEGLTPFGALDEHNINAAHALKDPFARSTAIMIKSGRGILAKDLAKNLPKGYPGTSGELRDILLQSDIIASETVLICKSSGDLVNRVESSEALKRVAGLGIKCSCGNPLEDEEIEESLSVTPRGHALLDKSQWMTIVLVDELRKIGVPDTDIFVEQQFGGDEIDCIAIISGDTVLFELKDKEFSLGNAYSFNAKVAILRPDLSVVVTTEQVGNDAKDHFLRARRAATAGRRGAAMRREETEEPALVEGIEKLAEHLEKIGTSLVSVDARRQLRDLLLSAALSPTDVVRALADPTDEG